MTRYIVIAIYPHTSRIIAEGTLAAMSAVAGLWEELDAEAAYAVQEVEDG